MDDARRRRGRLLRVHRLESALCAIAAAWPAVVATAVAGPAAAQQASRLRLMPDSIVLTNTLGRSVLLIQNDLGHRITNVSLSSWTNDNIAIILRSSEAAAIDAGGNWSTEITVSGRQPLLSPAVIWLRADYTTLSDSRTSRTSSFATLRVFARPEVALDKMVGVDLISSLSALTDRRSGTVYVVVDNKSDVTLDVGPIRTRTPEFMNVDTADTGEFRLGPHMARSVPVGISAGRRVRPGKHLLVFEVPISWESVSGPYSVSFVRNREVDIGVLGESEVLKLLVVPSFLVLPGFLVLVTFGMIWRSTTAGRSRALPWEFPKGDFWVIAITISGVMAVACRLVGVSYLVESYGVGDVATVWLLSIGVGCVAAFGIATRIEQTEKKRLAQEVPAPGDDPATTLEKLGKRRLGVARDVVDFADERVFALERHDYGQARYWIAPPITVTWDDKAGKELVTELDAAIKENDAARAAAALREATKRGFVKVTWLKAGGLVGPSQVEAAKLGWFAPVPMIQQE